MIQAGRMPDEIQLLDPNFHFLHVTAVGKAFVKQTGHSQGRASSMNFIAAICLPLLLLACMRPDPVPFTTDGLGFQVTSIRKSGADYQFVFSLYDKSSYGPVAGDSIGWSLSIDGRDSGINLLRDGKSLIGLSHLNKYSIPTAKLPFLAADTPYPVIVSVEFLSKGEAIRKDTLHAFLETDSNQFLDSNFLAVLSGYLKHPDISYAHRSVQIHGYQYYYRYILDDSAFTRGGERYPGYYHAVKISGAKGIHLFRHGYIPLRRAFGYEGEIPQSRSFDGDAGMQEDSLLLETWAIFGKKYFQTREILRRN